MIANVNKKGTEVTYKNSQILDMMEHEIFDLVMVNQGSVVIGYPFAWYFKAPTILLAPNVLGVSLQPLVTTSIIAISILCQLVYQTR